MKKVIFDLQFNVCGVCVCVCVCVCASTLKTVHRSNSLCRKNVSSRCKIGSRKMAAKKKEIVLLARLPKIFKKE